MKNIKKDLERFKDFETSIKDVTNSLRQLYQRKSALFKELLEWYFHGKQINVTANLEGLEYLLKLEERYNRMVERKVRRFVKALNDMIKHLKKHNYRTNKQKAYGALAENFLGTLLKITDDCFIIMKQLDHRRRKEEKFLKAGRKHPKKVAENYGKFLEQIKKEKNIIAYSGNLKNLVKELRGYELELEAQDKSMPKEDREGFDPAVWILPTLMPALTIGVLLAGYPMWIAMASGAMGAYTGLALAKFTK